MVERAKAAGMGLSPLSRFHTSSPARAGLVLGYGAVATDRIDEGLRRLRASITAAARTL